jgi:hypothetical protein
MPESPGGSSSVLVSLPNLAYPVESNEHFSLRELFSIIHEEASEYC